ncbi:MAG: VanZ family protein [Ruminococcus sp.]|nr:VanZ family protein [Ruminococcus sp.]
MKMKKPLKILLAYLPALICMAAIFFFSAQSAGESSVLSDTVVDMIRHDGSLTERLTVIVRKTAHFLEYALLGGLLYTGNRLTGVKRRLPAAAAVSSLYAVSDEIHQYFVPGRACMAADVLLDSCGALAGAAAAMLIFKIIGGKKE